MNWVPSGVKLQSFALLGRARVGNGLLEGRGIKRSRDAEMADDECRGTLKPEGDRLRVVTPQ